MQSLEKPASGHLTLVYGDDNDGKDDGALLRNVPNPWQRYSSVRSQSYNQSSKKVKEQERSCFAVN